MDSMETNMEASITSSPASLERQALFCIAMHGLDYNLPKSLARELVGMEADLKAVFPDGFFHQHCKPTLQCRPTGQGSALLHMGLSVSWMKGGLWTLKKFTHRNQGFTPKPYPEIKQILLFPNVEVKNPDLASFLLLPPSTKLYDSLPEVTITKVKFSLATKSLLLKGSCKSSDGKRFFFKTTLKAKVFEEEMHMTTLLYEQEDQVLASVCTSAVFLPSFDQSMEKFMAPLNLLPLGSDWGDPYDGPMAPINCTYCYLPIPSSEVPDAVICQCNHCILESGEDTLCKRCLNDPRFDKEKHMWNLNDLANY